MKKTRKDILLASCKAGIKLVLCVRKPAESTMKDAHSTHRMDVHSAAFPCVGKCAANNPAFPNGMGETSVLIDTEL